MSDLTPQAPRVPEGGVLFDFRQGAGPQPAFPKLPDDISNVVIEALMHVGDLAPRVLMGYIENDQHDFAKALVADMRRIAREIGRRAAEAAATCDCENCVARRKAEGEAIDAVAKAKGVPPAAVNGSGETLH